MTISIHAAIGEKDFSIFSGLLKQISQQGNANCIIAGGCLRDTLFNKPVKDIDVFYWEGLPVGLHKVIGLFDLEEQEDFGYVDNNQCTHKAIYMGIPVDFIKVPNGTGYAELLDSFPVSISRIGMSILGNLFWDNSFLETYKTKKIVYKNENQYNNYIGKILSKYMVPEFDYVAEESIFKIWQEAVGAKSLIKPKPKLTPIGVKYKVINIKSTEPVYKML